jgi:hypothetical protein
VLIMFDLRHGNLANHKPEVTSPNSSMHHSNHSYSRLYTNSVHIWWVTLHCRSSASWFQSSRRRTRWFVLDRIYRRQPEPSRVWSTLVLDKFSECTCRVQYDVILIILNYIMKLYYYNSSLNSSSILFFNLIWILDWSFNYKSDHASAPFKYMYMEERAASVESCKWILTTFAFVALLK